MPLVLDASVTLAWCFRDEQSEYATHVLQLLENDTAIVPGLWLLEVANALLVAERRGRLSTAEIIQVRGLLADLPIVLEQPSFDVLFGSILSLGREHNLSAYDAAYLELAMREGLPLATGDQKLQAAAHRTGVETLG